MKKYSLESGIEYERSPLQLTRVEITNREDLNGLYRIGDSETIYEVCLTAYNPAAYNGRFLNCLEFRTEDERYTLHAAYPEGNNRIGWYADRAVLIGPLP